ncbi:hypothetical protein ACJJI3_12430 [Microbulbifer sp. ZKSA004]|uniref:hypothetical protein n=1 Tax=Microbulbifer sp. ZKSA004 TaxID=3243389 RepID=UPI00403950F3
MLFNYKLILSFALLVLASIANANEENVARELASAIREDMIVNYSCQEYLGGLARYRQSKRSAISIVSKITGDRNQAVLSTNEIEKYLRASSAQEDLRNKFNELNLEYSDRVKTCQDVVAEHYDRVQVLMAKLEML